MKNIGRLMECINDEKTCALVTDDINRRFFTGFRSSAGTLLCFREKAYLIIDFRYFEKASEVVDGAEVILEGSLTQQMKELFIKHGVTRILTESETMTVSRLHSLEKELCDFCVDSSDELSCIINKLRITKSPAEIKKISDAQRIAESAFEYVLDNIKRGMTEREVALILDDRMRRLGAEDISFDTIVLNGKNTSLPHGVPGSRKIEDGFVLMDFGAVVDGYHSDMTRTFYIGTPSDEEKRAYDTVLEAQLLALDSVRPGITASELDSIARKYIYDKGYEGAFGHSLGHGVGMEIHEKPFVSSRSTAVLEEGMIITIEPGIYIPGKFGIRIEDMVAITYDLYTNLTLSKKELIVL
ncbi:MAG: aminopeptidase P family protein [Ruminococcus sp.]|nr:aminopeptidase P family protein [Ruminococcus sp.]